MKILKNGLMVLGVFVLLSALIFAGNIADTPEEARPLEDSPTAVVDSVKAVAPTYQIASVAIPKDLNFAGEPVPLDDSEIYERADREFLVNTYWQSNAVLLMKRAHQYFPIIEPILAKNGIPDDFKYLAVAESALQNVVSPAGATGFWQLMKGTAKEYGLEVNSNVDERYNVALSTQVACEYLKKSKEHFGSWTLAAASYNAGVYGVEKYMKIQKVDNYWDLLLGQETSRYVFRVMAIKEILSNPQHYGFQISEKDMYPRVPVRTVEVDTAVSDFADFARGYKLSYKTLKRHNPWLREPHLNNASRKLYHIEIPEPGYYRTMD